MFNKLTFKTTNLTALRFVGISLILFCSCQTEQVNTEHKSIPTLTKEEITKEEIAPVKYKINDSIFLSAPWDIEMTSEALSKNLKGFYIEKDSVTNHHNSNQIDTIVRYLNSTTMIEFYKIPDKEFLTFVEMSSNSIPMKYGIKIGALKSEIEEILQRKISGDSTEISDSESEIFTLKFSNNKLQRITYRVFLD